MAAAAQAAPVQPRRVEVPSDEDCWMATIELEVSLNMATARRSLEFAQTYPLGVVDRNHALALQQQWNCLHQRRFRESRVPSGLLQLSAASMNLQISCSTWAYCVSRAAVDSLLSDRPASPITQPEPQAS